MEGSRIYLDHAATTPVRAEVREAMEPFFSERFGNPSSLHQEGRAAREALEAARESIARSLGARDFRIAFTSGGTEADDCAVLGALLGARGGSAGAAGLHAIASAVEHPAVLRSLDLARALGFDSDLAGVDREARVDPAGLERLIRPATCLISVMAAQNEVGTLQPIAQIGERARARGIAFHTDATQLLGKGSIDLRVLPVDILTLSGHKVYGPKGAGAILVRRGLRFESLLRGGGQEDGLRAGTQAVALAVGVARAVELSQAEVSSEGKRLAVLRDRLRRGIESSFPGARINTPSRDALPSVLNVSFEGVEGESLLKLLDHLGVAVSTGSACGSGSRKASHVLQAMGLAPGEVRGSLRFSLGRSTGEREIDDALRRLAIAVEKLRGLSKV
jgi:cysteine desulfurase